MKISFSKVLISALLATSISYADISLNKTGYFGEVHYDSKTSGDYIYTATSTGMVVLDKTNLAAPKFASKYTTTEDVKGIDLKDSTALLAAGKSGLHVVNISDPLHPVGVAIDTNGEALDVAVDGDFAYVADGSKGLKAFSLLDPANVTKLGEIVTGGEARAVTIASGYAYVATSTGVDVINVSNPAALTKVNTINNPNANDVFIKNNLLYVASGTDGLKVYDISTPSAPTAVAEKNQPAGELGNSLGVAVENSVIFVANGMAGINTIDDSTNDEKANLDTSGSAMKVNTLNREGFIGLSDGAGGFDVIDYRGITDTNTSNDHLSIGASYATVGIPEKTVVKGTKLYVADQDGGLQILDITDPAKPTRIGGVDTGTKADAVAINDDETKAYLTDENIGLIVVDISDKTNPTFDENSIVVIPKAKDIKVKGSYAYIAARETGLHIVDISNPTNMITVGSIVTGGKAVAVDVAGDYAYVADENETLKIINITDPANPSIVGTYTHGYSHDIKVVGNYAYIANFSYGLQIVDVSDPANPTLKGTYDFDDSISTDHASGIDVSGNYAYLAYNDLGVKIIDISNPENPIIAAQKETDGTVKRVTVSGDYVYASNQGRGIDIYSTAQLNPIQSFVSRLYRKMLHKTYDKEGLDYWVGELNNGKSALDIAEQFFFDDSFRNANLSEDEFITRLYNTFLDREPDEEGLNYWKGLMDNKGYSKLLVLYGFAFSDEFKDLADKAGLTPYNSQNQLKAFLERLYALVMSRPQDDYGKAFDQTGLDYWTGALTDKTKTGGDVVKDFYNADEFTSKNLSDIDFIRNAYYAIMGREPDADGLNYWLTQMGNGLTRNGLLDQFIHSDEFQKYANDYNIKPF